MVMVGWGWTIENAKENSVNSETDNTDDRT